MKRCLFPHGDVARRCHKLGYVASSRLALQKNPSVLFVPAFRKQTTKISTLIVSLILFQTASYASDMLPASVNEIPLYAMSLIGTPYKYGGKSPETGMDCSGFVGHVFKETTGTQLPASARQISQHGQPLQTGELQPGDLVFFNTLNRAFSHVGIYLGENRFVHSTSSATGTVMVSNMDDNYWSKRFDGARRLINTLTDFPSKP